jgi:hypothetical protein
VRPNDTSPFPGTRNEAEGFDFPVLNLLERGDEKTRLAAGLFENSHNEDERLSSRGDSFLGAFPQFDRLFGGFTQDFRRHYARDELFHAVRFEVNHGALGICFGDDPQTIHCVLDVLPFWENLHASS